MGNKKNLLEINIFFGVLELKNYVVLIVKNLVALFLKKKNEPCGSIIRCLFRKEKLELNNKKFPRHACLF